MSLQPNVSDVYTTHADQYLQGCWPREIRFPPRNNGQTGQTEGKEGARDWRWRLSSGSTEWRTIAQHRRSSAVPGRTYSSTL